MNGDDHYSATSKQSARRLRLTRRQTLAAAGAAGAVAMLSRGPLASFAGSGASEAEAASCVLAPAKTEGPYFVDELLQRSDVRSDSDGTNRQAGVPLGLTLNIVNEDDGCSVGEGVIVDIWHANAGGEYSDIAGGTQGSTVGHDWLRGFQVTDANGRVEFETVYPGWYEGRTVHVHFKVRAFDGDSTTYEFTSQLFFDQSINDAVEVSDGYEGLKSVTNSTDSIYGGDTEVLVPLSGSVAGGYAGEITIGLSGLPSGSDIPDGTTVVDPADEAEGRLAAAATDRDRHGRRKVVARISADEKLSVRLRLVRDGRTLARGRGKVDAGSHEVSIRIPGAVPAGAATLKAVLEDEAGNVSTAERKVRVPRGR